MRAAYLAVATALAVLLLYSVNLLPGRGDLAAPAQRAVSLAGTPGVGTYFIQNAYPEAATPNMVTVVLADYRSFDTLGEAFVVFTGGVACWLLLRRRRS